MPRSILPVALLDARLILLADGLCPACQVLWTVLIHQRLQDLSSANCADAMGLRNRYQLSRWLGQHHYPSFGSLVDWIKVWAWLQEWEVNVTPLAQQAWNSGVEPSVCYRTVRRVSKARWSDVCRSGLADWELRFKKEVRDSLLCCLGSPNSQ